MPNKELQEKICKVLRFDILTSTSAAGSGHPTTSLSAVELMAVLFFGGFLKYDSKNPAIWTNDRVVFSKGHASPLLYSLYQIEGSLSRAELMRLRKFDSVLEGHPTPRFKFVDAATGSLGQGLSAGVGMAMGIKLKVKREKLKVEREPKVWVLLGDSEMAEGQIWEALEIASYYKLDNLVGILDVNRLGQRGETMLGWDLETYEKRIEAFGWETIIVEDGNNLDQVYQAYFQVKSQMSKVKSPIMIIAKTIKGKGVSFLEDKEGWHGKTLSVEELNKALDELGDVDKNIRGKISKPNFQFSISNFQSNSSFQNPNYKIGDSIATRESYGDALVEIGIINSDVVVLDAETSNSTYSNKFQKNFPERFYEMFIAEQNMVSAALGFSKIGFIPFTSSFAAFLTRSFDQIRMAQYSNPNIKIVGSHCGVAIGEDGPSQMGLEDISMAKAILNSKVLYPADGVSTNYLTKLMVKENGIFYLRTTRNKTPVIYSTGESFEIGGSKIHFSTIKNQKAKILILAAGITLHQALKAQIILAEDKINCIVLDCYSIKPIDAQTIQKLSADTNLIVVVEDHYPSGGLGEEVIKVVLDSQLKIKKYIHLCVKKLPRSGSAEDLMANAGIDAKSIVKAVKNYFS